VQIDTNGHRLTIVFSDLTVTPLSTGYAPFTIDETS
jgi:hypothetical protein